MGNAEDVLLIHDAGVAAAYAAYLEELEVRYSHAVHLAPVKRGRLRFQALAVTASLQKLSLKMCRRENTRIRVRADR